MARTEDEITAELIIWQEAQTAILKGGQSYTIDSGGSKRTVVQADLALIKQTIRDLYDELDNVNGNKGFMIGAGW